VTHRILVLSPHTDDAELGCGGTLAKYAEAGHDIHHIAFSTLPRDRNQNKEATKVYVEECQQAGRILGVNKVTILNLHMREFPQYRQFLLDRLIQERDTYVPSIVFIPSSHDIHQDHHAVYMESLRAFKHSTILGYELPWNNLSFPTQCFSPLTDKLMDKKLRAVFTYKSQVEHYNYFSDEFITSLGRTRGVQIGCKYAETFEVVRWVI
jgi:LmbE family N-acetylglucosaminyl deacetylase